LKARWGSSTMPAMKALLHKYNGHLALALILALVVSSSLQLVHDQLVDHEHGIECPMFMVDGNSPLPSVSVECVHTKQNVESVPFTLVAFAVNTFNTQQARAPPIFN